jgi:hypothetical protein
VQAGNEFNTQDILALFRGIASSCESASPVFAASLKSKFHHSVLGPFTTFMRLVTKECPPFDVAALRRAYELTGEQYVNTHVVSFPSIGPQTAREGPWRLFWRSPQSRR